MNQPINNNLYRDLADSWWDENGVLHLLRVMVNPWRVPYFTGALYGQFGNSLKDVHLLDIGCGGGVLTEEYARLGCQVTGIDLSAESIAEARAHASAENLSIDYRTGNATDLQFEDESFDVVSCCDVLEHIDEWEKVILEIGRVLKRGGLFLFDTINRTLESKIAFIFGLQEWSFTRLFPKNTHIWEMFIRPAELRKVLTEHGLQTKGMSGGSISRNPFATLGELRRYKRGKISVAELGKRLELVHSSDFSLNYLGYAQKAVFYELKARVGN